MTAPALEPVTGRSIPRYRGRPVRHQLRFYAQRTAGGCAVVAECDAGDFRTTIDDGHTAADLTRLNRQHNGKP